MLSTKTIGRGLRLLLDALVPEVCPACALSSRDGFCESCRATFGMVTDPCPRCGLPHADAACAAAAGWRLDAVQAPFAYASPLSRHLQALKFGRQLALGRALGLLLADQVDGGDADAIIAVPLHAKRLRERGFNQADEIAAPLAQHFRLPRLAAGVRRTRATMPQTGLDVAARRRNLAAAFSVHRDLGGMRIAIVDDVMTTGATANALATALRGAGAERVVAWSVARALP